APGGGCGDHAHHRVGKYQCRVHHDWREGRRHDNRRRPQLNAPPGRFRAAARRAPVTPEIAKENPMQPMSPAQAAPSETAWGNWIGGSEVAPSGGRSFASYNPTTGAVWGRFALGDADDVRTAVAAAQTAFATWRAISPTRRG